MDLRELLENIAHNNVVRIVDGFIITAKTAEAILILWDSLDEEKSTIYSEMKMNEKLSYVDTNNLVRLKF